MREEGKDRPRRRRAGERTDKDRGGRERGERSARPRAARERGDRERPVRRIGRRPVGDDVLDPEMAVAVGDTLEQAIKGALEVLGAREDEVDVEILEEGRRSLLGFGKNRPYRVRATWREDDEETIEEEISSEESAAARRESAAPRRVRHAPSASAQPPSPSPGPRGERRPREARASSELRERGGVRRDREPRQIVEPSRERTQAVSSLRSELQSDREPRPRRRTARTREQAPLESARREPDRPQEAGATAPVRTRREQTLSRVERVPSRPAVEPGFVDASLVERARTTATQLLADMGMEARVSARESAGDVWVAVESDVDDALLIGRRGETRNALQYVVQRLLGPRAEASGSVIVDVNGYWERRMAQLAEEARTLANEVAGDGRERRTEPLTAQERRVVHRALTDDRRVRTESLGDGEVKRVAILPGSSR